MSLHVNSVTVDSADPALLARFWTEALGWVLLHAEAEEALIAPGHDPAEFPEAVPILFSAAAEPKTVKNRLHLDLVPDDQEVEVARLEALGATRVDIGQREVDWVVMGDPEGNEFCVLRTYEG